jgi:hypothetical protein
MGQIGNQLIVGLTAAEVADELDRQLASWETDLEGALA